MEKPLFLSCVSFPYKRKGSATAPASDAPVNTGSKTRLKGGICMCYLIEQPNGTENLQATSFGWKFVIAA
jgi:hypothetical protein